MDDLISRQAAIEAMAELQGSTSSKGILKGISKAWKRIEQLPSIQPVKNSETPNSSDVISRQQAIEAVKKNTFRLTFAEEQNCEGHVAWSAEAVYSDVMEGALLDLPPAQPAQPAQPERIKGHWIESDAQNRLMKNLIAKGETWRVCDKCGAGFMIGYQHESDKIYHETFHNFCPNCGADMRGVTDGNHN